MNRLFGTLWTVDHQSPLSMGFSRQEYWSGSPCPSPGDLPDPGIEPKYLMSPELADGFFTTSDTWEALLEKQGGAKGKPESASVAILTFDMISSNFKNRFPVKKLLFPFSEAPKYQSK